MRTALCRTGGSGLRSRLLAGGVAVAAAVALTGCSGGAGGAASSPAISVAAGSKAAALLPADVRARGSITVVTDITYPPFGFTKADGKTFTGIDVDTAAALEPLLGIRVKVVNAGFDAFIPGLQAGRFDAGFNAITDTPERRKVVDFIDFNKYGGLFLTRPNSPLTFDDSSTACGRSVGAEKGSDTITFLQQISAKCPAGKKVDVRIFGTQADSLVALASGRVDAVLGPSTSGYLADHSNGKYVVNGPLQPTLDGGYDVGGMALKKDSPITKAMLEALTELHADGTLAKIYGKYDIAADGLTVPAVNAG